MIYNKEINLIGYSPEKNYNEHIRIAIHDYIINMELINHIIIDSTGNDIIDFIKFVGYDNCFHFMKAFNTIPEKVVKEINDYILSHIEK